MLPASLLIYRATADRLVPAFLGPDDHPWLRALLDERDRFVGHRRRELRARLQEGLSVAAPTRKRALAAHVVDALARDTKRGGLQPRVARAELFTAAAASPLPRDEVVASIARGLAISPQELEDALFADLPGERIVAVLAPPLSPPELAARANLALASGLLGRASRVTIEIEGNALRVVRRAKLRGLIVSVERAADGAAVLEISGPLALFHHTRMYGRALGDLLPLLAWCRRFRLQAHCIVAEGARLLELGSGDLIFPADEARRYDSKVEERFARDVGRALPDWDVVRDPEPLHTNSGLAFPDFALVHRAGIHPRWLVEIVGFWTPEYLARKLATYGAAKVPNLVLCIDEQRRCAEGDIPTGARVVWYRRRIDPAAVIEAITSTTTTLCIAQPDDEATELLVAIREIASRSRYGNAFLPLIARQLGRRVLLSDLIALCRSGHVALNRPTSDYAVRPLDPRRVPAAATGPSVHAHIAEAIVAVRTGALAPLYHLVREHFDWAGHDGGDLLLPAVNELARQGVLVLGERNGRMTIDVSR